MSSEIQLKRATKSALNISLHQFTPISMNFPMKKIYLLLFLFSYFLIKNTPLNAQNATGMASYYADQFNGRKTASGEIFDNNKMTAAHRTLRFGTMIKVTNLNNNKSVLVRVNDRGPYAHNRLIDLSKNAASQIGMVLSGTARVRVEVVENGKVAETLVKPKEKNKSDKPNVLVPKDTLKDKIANQSEDDNYLTGNSYSSWGTKKEPRGYGVQVGSYGDVGNARDLCKALAKEKYEDSYIQVGWSDGKKVFRVLVGEYYDKAEADAFAEKLKKANHEGYVKKHFD